MLYSLRACAVLLIVSQCRKIAVLHGRGIGMGPKIAGGMLGIDWCWGKKGQSFTGKVPHLFASARSTMYFQTTTCTWALRHSAYPVGSALQSGTLGDPWVPRNDLAGLGPLLTRMTWVPYRGYDVPECLQGCYDTDQGSPTRPGLSPGNPIRFSTFRATCPFPTTAIGNLQVFLSFLVSIFFFPGPSLSTLRILFSG